MESKLTVPSININVTSTNLNVPSNAKMEVELINTLKQIISSKELEIASLKRQTSGVDVSKAYPMEVSKKVLYQLYRYEQSQIGVIIRDLVILRAKYRALNESSLRYVTEAKCHTPSNYPTRLYWRFNGSR
jgi:hypothetical protein